ncbi:hypothetical protein VQ045_02105 [Aurantimonas sp. E1-2-R+4]|uniref:hypothetical protein n=1 Tax=Aurantimonas sp. E1-2-R+4 TaxID=3113714 RepID=UPI002F94EE20
MEKAHGLLADFNDDAAHAITLTVACLRDGIKEDQARTGDHTQASLTMTTQDWEETFAFFDQLVAELKTMGDGFRISAVLLACDSVPTD